MATIEKPEELLSIGRACVRLRANMMRIRTAMTTLGIVPRLILNETDYIAGDDVERLQQHFSEPRERNAKPDHRRR